ncbi:hypothetical protein Sme01_66620 [Sphaerisporangium melleum]|uniref:Uncharacterized protein n=1 Tax=Sphaerisporangium melleum TaxID=321316 RepID=A0A917RGA0_9ACTN|nr:hypothetical protein [Sphaerisporangium melleum]GGL06393.1 hypothetical protein GCM10007964_55850 [Sphaerisporangium melleum]GII74186.1 hypothetical protein Sme01_66620 [Sphaerisporangium melleum]
MLKWDQLSPGEKRAAVALAAMLPGYINAVFVAEHLAEAIAWQRGELTDEQLMERTGWTFNATPEQYADMAMRSARRAGVDPVEWLDAMKGAYEEQRAIAAELQQRGAEQAAARGDEFWEIIRANTWPDGLDGPSEADGANDPGGPDVPGKPESPGRP